jgi:hypothetical protein
LHTEHEGFAACTRTIASANVDDRAFGNEQRVVDARDAALAVGQADIERDGIERLRAVWGGEAIVMFATANGLRSLQ